jgi:hypothetical protein
MDRDIGACVQGLKSLAVKMVILYKGTKIFADQNNKGKETKIQN